MQTKETWFSKNYPNNANDLIAGDIVQYKMEGFTVVHRVIEKKQKNG